MKENFKAALDFVMAHECVFAPGHEGDYSHVTWENVPGDNGGLTKFGIDQASHPDINIKALDYSGAQQLYRDGEWRKCRCDDLPSGIDLALFDTAVNCGIGTSVKMLQRACNEAGAEPKLVVDGFIGPKTIAATERNPKVLFHFLALRDQRYRELAEISSLKQFLKGWLNRIADLQTTLQQSGLTNSESFA